MNNYIGIDSLLYDSRRSDTFANLNYMIVRKSILSAAFHHPFSRAPTGIELLLVDTSLY